MKVIVVVGNFHRMSLSYILFEEEIELMVGTLLLRSLGICWIWNRLNGGNRRNWILDLISRGLQSWDSGSSLIIGLHSCRARDMATTFCVNMIDYWA
jgi:hypothetical protein